MARPRRSTRARRPRAQTPSDVSADDSDVYSADERTRRRSRTSRTPREDTSEDEEANDDTDQGDRVEIDGHEYRVEDDSLVLETDPAGEKKMDAQGRLLGGRSYRVATLTSPERSDPERLYMLSIDIARVLGYRDSAYFFRKNPLFNKVFLTQDEKDTLVADGRLNSSLRTRNVTMVTARSVFMQMGARVVARGRLVTDDYYEAQARAEGKKEGAPVAMPSLDDILRAERRRESDRERERGRRRPDASTYTTIDAQGETIVTTFGDAGHAPFERAASSAPRRALLQRADLSEDNWMAEYARSVRNMNAELLSARREQMVAFPRTPKCVVAPTYARAMQADEEDHLFCDTRPPWERAADADPAVLAARQRAERASERRARRATQPPVGLYDPHTHTPMVDTAMQPRAAHFAKVADTPSQLPPSARLAGLCTIDTSLCLAPT
ncbi:chromatin structure-remodeling complex subunit RSC7 [Malassezia equina]|uniref:Chromatin structure-remodeling complex subunit RSC7 n=1 Tax=Malassezia equina TaxID=1381935 RepID=A0AAF0EFL5_9BASI|nr:chromatin structure-remodeling complex subunit RSC7 [Malassezia equina]